MAALLFGMVTQECQGWGGEVVKLQVSEELDPKKAFHHQECHKCRGHGRYKCSGCHGAGMVSYMWLLVSVARAEERHGDSSGLGRGLGAPQANSVTSGKSFPLAGPPFSHL